MMILQPLANKVGYVVDFVERVKHVHVYDFLCLAIKGLALGELCGNELFKFLAAFAFQQRAPRLMPMWSQSVWTEAFI